MNRLLYILLFFTLHTTLFCGSASAQSARDLIRLGNVAYRAQQYDKAETMYIKSIEKNPSFEAYYNLGNALVMQQKDSTANAYYLKADSIGTNDPLRRARNFHNMGNIWYAQGMGAMRTKEGNAAGAFQNAVNFYKSSLRCNPADDETRYNLAMAQYMLKKNQNNNGNGGGGGNDDKNKDKDKDKQDQQQQNQDQNKQDQNKQEQQQPQEQKDEMSEQNAEQLLNSAQQDEKSVQRKVKQNQNGKRRNLEKDW